MSALSSLPGFVALSGVCCRPAGDTDRHLQQRTAAQSEDTISNCREVRLSGVWPMEEAGPANSDSFIVKAARFPID